MVWSVLHCRMTNRHATELGFRDCVRGLTPVTNERIGTSGMLHPATVVDGIERRSLLRLMLATGAIAMGPFAFAQTGGSPKRGGRLTIGADADPIGLDPVTVA